MQLQLLQLATIERNMICFGSLYFVLNRKVRKDFAKFARVYFFMKFLLFWLRELSPLNI
jgi:hypothetical protein